MFHLPETGLQQCIFLILWFKIKIPSTVNPKSPFQVEECNVELIGNPTPAPKPSPLPSHTHTQIPGVLLLCAWGWPRPHPLDLCPLCYHCQGKDFVYIRTTNRKTRSVVGSESIKTVYSQLPGDPSKSPHETQTPPFLWNQTLQTVNASNVSLKHMVFNNK